MDEKKRQKIERAIRSAHLIGRTALTYSRLNHDLERQLATVKRILAAVEDERNKLLEAVS